MFRLRTLRNKLNTKITSGKKFSSSEGSPQPEIYAKGLRLMHLIGAIGITGCTISGYIASRIDPKKATPKQKELKGTLMFLHKSFGLLMFAAIVPRIYSRVAHAVPALTSHTAVETVLAKVSHYSLYFMLVFMPTTGVMMGYFSGGGVPFFAWKMPGAPKAMAERQGYKNITGWSYRNHKRMGQVLEFLIPIHIGAVGFNYFARGQNLLARINPFK